jgi:hypothetical protein
MLDLIQVLAADGCEGIGPIVSLIKNGVMPIIQIGIPILLIVFGSIDLGKAVMANDDKEIKTATGKLIKRIIAGVVIFFIPFLVNLVMSIVAGNSDGEAVNATDFVDCWNNI